MPADKPDSLAWQQEARRALSLLVGDSKRITR